MSGSTELSISTPPSITQCQNTSITWYGGVEPFYVGYIASGTVGTTSTPSPAVAFRTEEHSQEWLCNVAAGVEITLNVRDSAGTISYSSPIEVQNSTDLTCLPGYVPPPSASSSKLSKGAIGGIAAGSVVGAIILAAALIVLWRRRQRRRTPAHRGAEWTEKGSEQDEGGNGEPKVEPYVRQGDIDLADEVNYASAQSEIPTPVPALEREVKQMLGVQPTSATTVSASRTAVSPIPTKSHSGSGPSRTTVLASNSSPVHSPTETETVSSPPGTLSPDPTRTESTSAGEPHGDVEYVRHTDGGGMRVELPPLYSDVPRDQAVRP